MVDLSDYIENCLKRKVMVVDRAGWNVDPKDLHPAHFPHQRDAIIWALSVGRALIAASFGLGKTAIQCEIARQVHNRTGKPFLVVCPLGAKHQFSEEDGPRLDMVWQYVRTDAEAKAAKTPYLLSNYERVRDGDLSAEFIASLGGASLDEGSVLRSLGSETQQVFTDVFAPVPYRYVATATPSPNDYIELINYSDFLSVMDRGQALTRFFKRDSMHAGHLTIKGSQEKEFWFWVASWALFLYKPSDLGYPDDGYVLPELNVTWHRVDADQTRAWKQVDSWGQRRLMLDAGGGVREAAEERRETLPARMAEMRRILADNPDRHWLLWHYLERERDAIEKEIPDAVTVYGSQELEVRERHILDFAHGIIPIMASKPEIAGSGCNFQYHCHSAIFLGVDYRFQDFIQAVHRVWRFQQKYPVDIHIIYADSEENVVETMKRKWAQHDALVEKMRAIVREYGLTDVAIRRELTRTLGVERMDTKGKLFYLVNNDCVAEMANIPDNSVGLIHTSVPFGDHYEYSVALEDFGHNRGDENFWKQMDYLIPELLRVLKPGRVAAIHVKDRVLYGHQTESGFMEISPFSDECVQSFRKWGWMYEGRRTIMTDVVRENNSTYRLGWSELANDASKMGCGTPEYLLLFRKPPTDKSTARADEPIQKSKKDYTRGRWQVDASALWRSNGNSLLLPEELAKLPPDTISRIFSAEQITGAYDHERHVALCEMIDHLGRLPATFMLLPPKSTRGETDPVWDDVVYMHTLNSQQSKGRKENHICPLPIDIVSRTIRLYSNPGDIVFDPFVGIGTVVYVAIKLGRFGHGVELNSDYYTSAVKYCQEMEQEKLAPTLFDLIEYSEAVPAAQLGD